MNQDLIRKLIDYGIQAPSGDNSQPWKFVITKNNEIKLFNLPDRDNPVLNIHQGGSFISHGAVIFNIKIVADSLGYRTDVKYFPDLNDQNLVANLSFVEKEDETNLYEHSLVNFIKERSTNRRHYEKDLPNNFIEEIQTIAASTDFKVKIFNDSKNKDLISEHISISEEIILKTKELHQLLFKDVVWTKKQELRERHGLFVKTLEFNPVQYFVFWLCRKWKNISFLNKKIGFASIVAKQNADIYRASGLIGFIIIPDTDRMSYVKAGELFQHIWLKSTSLGLGFQPVTGLFFLNEKIKTEGSIPISEIDSKKITDSYNYLKNFVNANNDEILLTSFRIGKSKKSSGRSSRLKPNIILN